MQALRGYIRFILSRLAHCWLGDYSMILATLPEPTVRPPSRISSGVLYGLLGLNPYYLFTKSGHFSYISDMFGNFCCHFVVRQIITYSFLSRHTVPGDHTSPFPIQSSCSHPHNHEQFCSLIHKSDSKELFLSAA